MRAFGETGSRKTVPLVEDPRDDRSRITLDYNEAY